MSAMMTPAETQAAYPLPAGWRWDHDKDGWNAHEDEDEDEDDGSGRALRVVWIDASGECIVGTISGEQRGAPAAVVLAVVAANAPQTAARAQGQPAPQPMASYQALAQRTAGGITPAIAGLGLAGEAGEVADLLKKHLGHGHPLDIDKLRGELGDVLWYIAALCSLYNITLDSVAAANVAKLRARYPDGFSHEASRTRADCEGTP
jgi:NTP pyrophosphatase (non-canonical NTP hydrolase)